MDENKLILNNIGLIKKIVKSFSPRNANEYDELYSCGLFGLLKAIRIYKKDKNIKLSTLAYTIILREIIQNNNKKRIKTNYTVEIEKIVEKDRINLSEILPNNLSEYEQKIIDLKISGYTIKEISSIIKKPKSTVNNHIQKIIKKIKKHNET